jgi:hypothetical protein
MEQDAGLVGFALPRDLNPWLPPRFLDLTVQINRNGTSWIQVAQEREPNQSCASVEMGGSRMRRGSTTENRKLKTENRQPSR